MVLVELVLFGAADRQMFAAVAANSVALLSASACAT